MDIWCSLRSGPHNFFVSNLKGLSIFFSKAKTAAFFTLQPISLELMLIISSVSDVQHSFVLVLGQFLENLY